MPKPLPPSTTDNLNPPPGKYPYTFFENVGKYPFNPNASKGDLGNAWWLMDAAFLTYSPLATVQKTFADAGMTVTFQPFDQGSTQCYVASTDEWIVLAFRGTQVDDFCSFLHDLTAGVQLLPYRDEHRHWVHRGFKDALDDVWADLLAYIGTLQAHKARPLWITGHSLGAALATMAAYRLSFKQDPLGLREVYTYGSPRVGDGGFGKSIAVPVWRFRNNADIITDVPVGLVFRHVGKLQFIDGSGHLHRNVDRVAELVLGAASLQISPHTASMLDEALRLAAPNVPLPGFLADHAPINYSIRIWNCYQP
jgi:triacylglycerol lipase